MKFPRNAKILRSPSDVAPFAAVFFLLVIFLMVANLLPVPGIPLDASLQPPSGDNLPGVDKPVVAMAVDSIGRFYYENTNIAEADLKFNLATVASNAPEPLTLIIHADRAVPYETLAHLALLARDAGITNALLATLPRVTDAPARR